VTYRGRVTRLGWLLAGVLAVSTALPGPVAAAEAPAASAASESARASASARAIADHAWDSGVQWRSGRLSGVRVQRGAVVLKAPVKTRGYRGTRYDVGTWTSDWTQPGFGLTELIASWHARTPGDSWVEVLVRGRSDGTRTSWDVLGRWAAGDRFVRRTSVPGQGDDLADVAVDTWRLRPAAGAETYQLRVRLMRRVDARTASPRL
jgi:hypothetical protein